MLLSLALWVLTCQKPTDKAQPFIVLSDHGVYRPAHMAVSDSGVLVVADAGEDALFFFDADGRRVARAGRSGQGPQAFQNIRAVSWDAAAGVFAVCDAGNGRLSTWTPEGRHVRDQALPDAFHEAVVLQQAVYTVLHPYGGRLGTPTLMRHPFAGPNAGSVFWQHKLPPGRQLTQLTGLGTHPIEVYAHWDGHVLLDAGRRVLVYGFSADGPFWLHTTSAETAPKKLTPTLPRRPVTPDDVAHQLDIAMPSIKERLRKALVEADYWPRVQALRVDGHDHLWFFGYAPPNSPIPYQRYDPQGTLEKAGTVPTIPDLITQTHTLHIEDLGDHIVLLRQKVSERVL